MKKLSSLLLLYLAINACTKKSAEEIKPDLPVCDTTHITYATTVKPIIDANCGRCHSATSKTGIHLDTYEGVKAIADDGSLYGSIAHADGYSAMPKGKDQLPSCDISKIKKWIDDGAANN